MELITVDPSSLAAVISPTAPKETDYGVCLFAGSSSIYVDCCDHSSSQTVCTYLAVMFWVIFAAYLAIFAYIMNKNPWIRRQGLYINVFFFQMNVLVCKLKHIKFLLQCVGCSIHILVGLKIRISIHMSHSELHLLQTRRLV